MTHNTDHKAEPPPDAPRIDLYYKTIDSLTMQATEADSKALAVLTIEAALIAALAVAVPLLVPHPFHLPIVHFSTGEADILIVLSLLLWSVLGLALI